MSVNSAILDDFEGGPLPISSIEKFLFSSDDLKEFSFICGSGYPGSTLGYSSSTGKLYISNLRLIFIATPSLPLFQSFTCPFNKISQVILTSESFFSFNRNTVLKAKIIPQFELEERVKEGEMSDLEVRFTNTATAQQCESIIKPLLFTGPVDVKNSFEPLPLYTPPINQLPSYEEITRTSSTSSSTTTPSGQ